MTAPRNVVLRGNCLEVMRGLPADSIDAVVTDPPYELGFMGKSWDSAGVSYDPATWTEALRVLKPGGHLLAFGGSRTYHRIAVAIEDAGFEIRDSLMWIYGSGFPKSLDVSKAMDKRAGAEREVVGQKLHTRKSARGVETRSQAAAGSFGAEYRLGDITTPATDEAKRWDGWGTALKPSHEPIVLARKPLIGTVAENVLAHGTGAINIGASRIGGGEPRTINNYADLVVVGNLAGISRSGDAYESRKTTQGRWPANVLFDEEAAAQLDEQSGIRKSGRTPRCRGVDVNREVLGSFSGQAVVEGGREQDSGGASRFFYVAKPGKRERNAGDTANTHPTVKPIALMRYLIKLVTPPGGVVLDPFLGSGTTACAAVLEGFDYIGIEQTPEYADIAEARIAHYKKEETNG